MKKGTAKRLLTYKEAALEYGASVWSWRRLVWRKELPFVLHGNRHMLDRIDIEAYISKNKS